MGAGVRLRRTSRRARPDSDRPRRALIALTLGVATILCSCRAPEAAPRSGVKNVHFQKLDGYLEYTFRDRRRDQESKTGSGDLDYKETVHEQAIQLETDGFVYHPNFLEFTLAGLFGLTQQDFEQTAARRRTTSSDDGDIYEFDISGLFFQRKPYPGNVYARRYRALEPRPFQSSLETTTTSYGFVWQYIDLKMPTTIQFNDTDVDIDPLNRNEASTRHTSTQFRFETAYKFSDNNVLTFWYQFRDETERPFELDFKSHEFVLSHELNFGDMLQFTLDSELNYFKQTGTFDIDRFRWRELFRIRHAENLESWYRFELIDRDQGSLAGVQPISERSVLFMGTVEHTLYESLLSELSGWVQDQDFSELTIKRYGAQGNLEYRKTNPWGMLHAGLRARFVREKRDGDNQTGAVIDERATFNDPAPIQLSNTNVLPGSIFVTSEDRTTIYLEGRDYRVTRIGDFTQLERIPTGRIANGQTVLISYRFEVAGDADLRTTNFDFLIEEDFDWGLTPYYRFRWQDQDLKPDDAPGITPDDITSHTIGTEYERGPLRLVAEYEDHDSTINPFRATRIGGDLNLRLPNGANTSVKARWTDRVQHEPVDRTIRFLTVEGRYRQNVTRHLYVEGSVLYRNQEDSIGEDFDGVDIDLSLEWIVRETEVRVFYEWTQFDGDFAENTSQAIYVQVKRRF